MAVVACGNLARQDDGAGPAVLAQLRRRITAQDGPELRLYDAATDGLAVLYQVREAERVLLIDASRGELEPGAICQVPGAEFVATREPPRDSHALRWDDALTIGQRLYGNDFVAKVEVYLIQVQNTGLGLELSPAVDAAVRQLSELLAQRLELGTPC